MSQRVNIQYSIDITDLEGEVQRLIDRSVERLEKMLSTFNSAYTDEDVLAFHTVESINSLRIQMAEVDYCLGDINKIVSEYVAYRLKETVETNAPANENEIPRSESEPEEPSSTSELSLQGALKEFKRSNGNL